jgi:hypothetical protein
MSRASVFIGSSSEGREVARAIGEGLECCADTVMWDEDVFEFGRGYLEELVAELDRHDFAVLVLTPDDVTESRGDSKKSPRDNVLFECGLFMGRLGRERTFIVCDRSTEMKLPSDLAGVSLISYDGKRMVDAPSTAVRGACMKINRTLKRPTYRELSGKWRSRYVFAQGGNGSGYIEEEVEVSPARGMLRIESKSNPKNENYVAYVRPAASGKHFVGEWLSTRHAASAGGAFFLTVHPLGNLMYGYYASPGDDHKVSHGGWVMARIGMGDVMAQRESLGRNGDGPEPKDAAKDAAAKGAVKQGANDDEKLKKKLDAQLKDLLDKGVRILKNSSPNLSAQGATSRNGSARNGSGNSRKAAAETAKAGKK